MVPGSVTTNAGSITLGENDSNFTVSMDNFTSTFARRTIRIAYNAILTDLVESSTTVSLSSTLSYLSSTTIYADQKTQTSTASITIRSPVVDVEQSNSSLDTTATPRATIGETVQFRITISLPEGITVSPVLNISTSASLPIFEVNVTSIGNAATCATLPVANMVSGYSLIAFDTLCNSGDNADTSDDQVTVLVTALVLNTTENAIGTSLLCTARFSYGNGYSLGAQETVSVVEPVVRISKVPSIPLLGGDYGEATSYNITAVHLPSSKAWAYNLVIRDEIPPSIILVDGSVESNMGTVQINGSTLTLNVSSLALSDTLWLAYNVTLAPSSLAGAFILNTVSLTYDTLPATVQPDSNKRAYSAASSSSISVGAPTVEFYIASSSTQAKRAAKRDEKQLAIGEELVFRIATSLPNGNIPFMSIYQDLPITTGQFVVEDVTVTVGVSIQVENQTKYIDGDKIWINFTNIFNPEDGIVDAGDYITIDVAAVVGIAQNAPGQDIFTQAVVSTVHSVEKINITMYIVGPSLTITSTCGPTPNYTQAGDVVTFTSVVFHTATSSGAAYFIELADYFPIQWALIAGSVSTSIGTIVKGNGVNDTIVLVELASLALDQQIVLTYQATITHHAVIGSVIPTNASVYYLSAPVRSSEVQTSRVRPSSPPHIVIAPASYNFWLNSTSLSETAPGYLVVGEHITIRVSFTLPSGTAPNTFVRFTLPTVNGAGMVAADARVVFRASTVIVQTDPVYIAMSNGRTIVTFDFGTVVNMPDGNSQGVNDTITVEIIALTPKSNYNVNGTTVSARASFEYNAQQYNIQPEHPIQFTIVTPRISLVQTVVHAATRVEAGTTVTFQVVISNLAYSSAPCYSLILLDTLSPEFTIVAGSINTTLGYVSNGTSFVGINIDVMLPTGGPIVIYYTLMLTTKVRANTPVFGGCTLTYQTAPASPYNDNLITVTTLYYQTSVVVAPPTADFALNHTTIGNGSVISVGEQISYIIIINLPGGTTGGVQIIITFPGGGFTIIGGTIVYYPPNMGSQLGPGSTGVVLDPKTTGTTIYRPITYLGMFYYIPLFLFYINWFQNRWIYTIDCHWM